MGKQQPAYFVPTTNKPIEVQFADQTPSILYVHWYQDPDAKWVWTNKPCDGEHCARCLNSDQVTKYVRWQVADGRTLHVMPALHKILWEQKRQMGKRRFFAATWQILKIRDETQWSRTSYEVERVPTKRGRKI